MSAGGGGGASSVTVLAPNGRRVTVRVGPGTTLLQVLEDVCKKQNFSPNEYDLKFQRTVLDLSLQWRFANLPNNAKLEMVPVSHNRVETETTVRIALQLDNGSRLQDTFSSSQTLWEILGHFAQTREYVEQHCEISPVCIYMRDEITGKSALEKTSLKSLGLTGGNAIIRVVLKVPTTAGHTEAGSSKSPSKKQTVRPASWEEQAGPSLPRTNTVPTTSAHSVEAIFASRCSDRQSWSEESPDSSVEHHPPSGPTPSSFVPFVGGGQRLGSGSSNVAVAMRSPASDVPLSSIPISSPGGPSKPKKSKNSQDEQKKPKEYLEREPIVCHPDLQKPLDSGLQDLPDEFFEVTVDDVRRRLSQLQNERQRLEEAPLMTQAQRDARMKEKLDRYSKVVLRVYFPDRHILQGFFNSSETVGALRAFVKSHLEDPEIPFYLFIAPPRSILSDDSLTLFQANLFPAAVVHFGSEKHSDHYLRPDLLESAVAPSEADLLVARSLPKSTTHPTQPSLEPVLASPPEPNEATESVVVRRSETAPALAVPQSEARRTPSGKVPKWLKLPGGKR
ncbi:tether containing UBX domain for GLUT4 [Tiliqua scincoides]|uniref:tether containing UBX domain for GLUT4 n=1 Tax=Tiliqua scincoides TaxID=71010 RepID=UPI003462A41F